MSRRRNKKKNKGLSSRPPAVQPVIPPQGAEYTVAPSTGNSSVLVQRSFMFQGPTPPPEVLREYAEIYPDAPRIIFEGFEKQSEHRRTLESRYMSHAIARSWGGLICAMVIVLALIGLGGFAVYMGQGLAGAAAFVSAMVGLVTVFIYGQSQQSKERESRAKTMAGK